MNKKDYDSLFLPTYKRDGAPITRGKGVYLYDSEEKKYLDFGSGIAVNALGHGHPAILKALRTAGCNVIHTSNLYYSESQISLAKMLLKSSFGDKVFFCNSGTEANEAAIKFSRKWAISISTEKYHVLSFTDGFHGRTYGALSATAQKKFQAGFGPMLDGFHYGNLNDIYGTKKLLESRQFAAIIVEPLQGEGGVITASTEFLRFLRAYADKNSIVLIFDEIQCGMGRTGWLWNYQQHRVVPDMMTLAKPIGGGLPLGVVVSKYKFGQTLSPGDHGTTFGGNSVACALGCEVLKTVSKKAFLQQVRQKGVYLKKKLIPLRSIYKIIEEVRGTGLLVGVQLGEDPQRIISECKNRGLLLVKAGHDTVRFMPPLTVSKKEIDRAVSIFSSALKKIYS